MSAPRRDAATYATSTKKGVASSSDMAASYLRTLKARGAEVGIWEIRGRVFARVMVAARDARLSGAEWSILTSIALHLQHLGRSKGMMTVGSLADDSMVTERTVRSALRVLEAAKFVSVKVRASGQMTVMLDRRFGPRAVVPGNQSADKSPRRSAPRKKISTIKPSLQSGFITNECTDSAARTARAESTASASQPRTANGDGQPIYVAEGCAPPRMPRGYVLIRRRHDLAVDLPFDEYGPGPPGHDPPRKRA